MTAQKKRQQTSQGYGYFLILSLGLLALAFSLDSPQEIFAGLGRILTSPSQLLTDYLVVGGLGATLVNVATMLLFSSLLAYWTGAPMTGVLLASFGTVAGFSFFGKHLLNSLPIMLGVYAYAKLLKHPLRNHLVVSLFGTTLAPAVSFVALGTSLPLYISLPWAFVTGFAIGLVLPPLATQFLGFHQGFSLYNIGFTAGLVAMVLTAIFQAFGFPLENQSLLYEGQDLGLYLFLYALVAIFAITALHLRRKGQPFLLKQILRSSGRLPSDFLSKTNLATVCLNVASLCLLATLFLQVLALQLTGPLIGGVITLMSFGAFGKHPRNVFPVMLGVVLTATYYHDSNHAILLTALFATSLAPISGYYGWGAGLLAGYIHMTLVSRVVGLHDGLNLYNNGFSAGFVAAFLVPIFDALDNIVKARRHGKKAGPLTKEKKKRRA